MYDKELAREILNQVNHATKLILNRFESVKNVIDFTNSPAGMEKVRFYLHATHSSVSFYLDVIFDFNW
ncbi:MAG: hypothetical protein ACMUIU_03445 [bacterium]